MKLALLTLVSLVIYSIIIVIFNHHITNNVLRFVDLKIENNMLISEYKYKQYGNESQNAQYSLLTVIFYNIMLLPYIVFICLSQSMKWMEIINYERYLKSYVSFLSSIIFIEYGLCSPYSSICKYIVLVGGLFGFYKQGQLLKTEMY